MSTVLKFKTLLEEKKKEKKNIMQLPSCVHGQMEEIHLMRNLLSFQLFLSFAFRFSFGWRQEQEVIPEKNSKGPGRVTWRKRGANVRIHFARVHGSQPCITEDLSKMHIRMVNVRGARQIANTLTSIYIGQGPPHSS